MTAPLRAGDKVLTLPEAARRLGVHRATVNDMVRSRRLPARRRHGQWYIDREDFDRFAATYVRPPNAPEPRSDDAISASGLRVLEFLIEWGDATVRELDVVIDLHDGNIRKQLTILAAQGFAQRDDTGVWRPTDAALALASAGSPHEGHGHSGKDSKLFG